MTNERFEHVQQLFLAASELSSHEQEAWLAQQCGDDRELYDEVRSLLQHGNPVQDPLEKGLDPAVEELLQQQVAPQQHGLHVRCPHCRNPIELVEERELTEIDCPSCGSSFSLIAGTETATYAPQEEETLAHFTLDEKLGMGSFGTVWRAKDTELDRTVALKVPRQGQLDAEETEKFLREARAAAQLKHPNIVSVHEVGRENQTVYIVSDYIDGITLTDWLTGQQPTPREAVELCIQVADALQHAHQQGVIHRDLKPGNILLDRLNEPHLTDFGLAKREAGEITMTVEGQILGTPAYMSPEQARGEGHDADARSDIYSLGVVLFELLTGERPFRGNTRMLIHQLLTEDAPSPRKLNAAVPRDLETICLKCLEKDPDRRFETAQKFKAELERWLKGEAILSRPISRLERGWRWCRRKPMVAGLSALLLISLTAGIAVSSYYAVEADRKAGELVNSLEEEQRLVSEKTALLTEKDGLLQEKEELISQLRTSQSNEKKSKEKALAKAAESQAVLDFFTEKVLAVPMPVGYAGGQSTLGFDVTIREALDAAEPQITESFTAQPLIEAAIRLQLGATYRALGQYEQALKQAQRSYDLFLNELGPEHVQTLVSMNQVALAYSMLGETLKAITIQEDLVPISRELLGDLAEETIAYMFNLGASYSSAARIQDAIRIQEQALAYYRKSNEGPTDAAMVNSLALTYQKGGRIEDSITLLQEALARVETAFGKSHSGTFFLRSNLAYFLIEAKRHSEAIDLLEPTMQSVIETHGRDHPATMHYLRNLASAYDAVGRVQDAWPHWEAYWSDQLTKRRVTHPDSPELGNNLAVYALFLIQQGKYKEAEPVVREAIQLRTRLGLDHWNLYAAKSVLGRALVGQGNYEEAESLLIAGYQGMMDRLAGMPSGALGRTDEALQGLIDLYQQWDKPEQVERWKQEVPVLKSAQEQVAKLHEEAITATNQGKLREAIALYEDASPVSLDLLGERVANLLARTAQWKRARGAFRTAYAVSASWQEIAVSYRLGEIDEYRQKRKLLLRDFQTVDYSYQYYYRLKMVLLMPVGEELQTAIRYLAKSNENHPESTSYLSLVGKAMYRLGEFREWFDALPADSPLRDGTGLLVAITDYQDDPSDELRQHLEQEIEQAESQALELLLQNRTRNSWPDYIEQMAWVHEAKHVLSGGESDSEVVVKWPDENFDLLAFWDKCETLQEQADAELEAGNLQAAIDKYQELASLPGETASPKLIDLYARTLQWDKLRELMAEPSFVDKRGWKEAMLHHKLGNFEHYQQIRKELLSNPSEFAEGYRTLMYFRMGLMHPLEPEVIEPFRELVALNHVSEKSWIRALIGKGMYRLGEFQEWYQQLPDDSPFRKGQTLLIRITDFEKDPSPHHRELLMRELSEQEKLLVHKVQNGELGKFWFDYCEQEAWVNEARRVLKLPLVSSSELRERAEKIEKMQQEAEQLTQDSRISEAIELYEQLDKTNGENAKRKLLELYARTMQWDKALEKIPTDTSDYYFLHRRALLLYLKGQFDELQKLRKDLISDKSKLGNNVSAHYGRIVFLLPIESDCEAAAQHLFEKIASPELPGWSKAVLGAIVYQLGEFEEWYRALPEDSPQRKSEEMLWLMVRFRRTPTLELKAQLEQKTEQLAGQLQKTSQHGDLGPHWHQYVRRLWLLRESQQILKNTKVSEPATAGANEANNVGRIFRNVSRLVKKTISLPGEGHLCRLRDFLFCIRWDRPVRRRDLL